MPKRAMTLLFPIAAALSLATAVPGAAQETPSHMVGGAWALQFRISNNFTLDTFRGTVVSLKRHYSPNTALRLGLTANVQSGENTLNFSDVDTSFAFDENTDAVSGRLDFQYLHYANPESRVSLFLGTGPFVQYSRGKYKSNRPEDRLERLDKSWGAGVSGVLGVEWSASSVVGIHAEYGVSAGYVHTDRTEERDYRDYSTLQKGHSWQLSGSSVLFGLSVYL
jgi:hypothetical protein